MPCSSAPRAWAAPLTMPTRLSTMDLSRARYSRFEAFAREHLHISPHRFDSLEELRAAELPYDVILSGSDQIWNPKNFSRRPV